MLLGRGGRCYKWILSPVSGEGGPASCSSNTRGACLQCLLTPLSAVCLLECWLGARARSEAPQVQLCCLLHIQGQHPVGRRCVHVDSSLDASCSRQCNCCQRRARLNGFPVYVGCCACCPVAMASTVLLACRGPCAGSISRRVAALNNVLQRQSRGYA